MKDLDKDFYLRKTVTVAKDLLGKYLLRNYNGQLIGGKIVETEAYLGLNDKAAHSYGGKITNRVKPLYGEAGGIYVYMIYGMYYCLNITTEETGTPECVLIRAIEPLIGLNNMSLNRFKKEYSNLKERDKKNLTSGPGKLCMALNIDSSLNNKMLGEELLIVDYDKEIEKLLEVEEISDSNIVEAKRIGIDYAEEAKDFLYRFYYEDNKHVSKK